ncbi:redoxin family protein [Mycolicibacillus koreensis]|uniref:redoxin family protein n=1 Tax=Mycolicibacillus koreensis TaxID=1069220 RepID=UPI0035591ED9
MPSSTAVGRRGRLASLLVALVGVLLVFAGCGSAAENPPTSGEGPPQLQFQATTLDGDAFDGATLRGTPAVFWFWAPWCPTCQREAPMVGAAADAHPTVTFVGVASASQPPAMREFVEKYSLGQMTHLADTDATVWKKFGVTAQPAFAFVTADGEVSVVKGELSADDLDQRVAALTGS